MPTSAWAWLAFAIGVLIRCSQLDYLAVWADEYYTIRTYTLPWPQLLTGQFGGDLNPPLYFVGLKLWTMFVGNHEVVLRVFSLGSGLITLAAIHRLARLLFGTQAALAALVILSFHPLFIFEATEIRGYALLITMTILALIGYYGHAIWASHRASTWTLMAASLAALPYIHHFGIVAVLCVGLFCLLDSRRQTLAQTLVPLSAIALALLLYLPGFWFVVRPQAAMYGVRPLTQITPATWLYLFSAMVELPFGLTNLLGILAVLAALTGGALLLGWSARPSIRFGFLMAPVLAGGALLYLQARGFNTAGRYLIPLFALVVLMMTYTLVRGGRAIRILGIAVVALYVSAGLSFAWRQPRLFPDWRQVAAKVHASILPNESVVILGWDARPVEYYLQFPTLASSLFEAELAEAPRDSYLLIDSEYALKLPLLDQARVIYSDSASAVRILRYTPALLDP